MASVPSTAAREALGELGDIEVLIWDGRGPRPSDAERIEFFVGQYNAAPPDAAALAGLPALRVVQLLSAGVDPWLGVVPPGVQLCNGRGVHGASTAELAVAGMLAMLRELPHFEQTRRARVWDHARTSAGLTGRRVLVVGAGDIGQRIAAAARIFDAATTLVARTARDGVRAIAELPQLLPDHDVVALAVPLTPQTRRLVDAAFLAALPDGALLVNVARGPVVDTDALLAELRTGRLRAVLDVTDPEPPPPDHPLWDAPNLLLTPHIGGGTAGWQRRAYALVREQLLRFHDGLPLHNVVEYGY